VAGKTLLKSDEMKPFLLEIGTEEIPASYLRPAAEEMGRGLTSFLDQSGIDHGETKVYYTPRRLAVLIRDVASKQKDSVVVTTGPPVSAAYDNAGNPTKAATGFARAHGIDVKKLERRETPKGQVLAVVEKKKGRGTSSLLAEYIPGLLASLSFPRSMSWEPSRFRFARPVRWIVALLGERVVSFTVAQVKSGSRTRGHRFLSPAPRKIENPLRYEEILRQKHVIADAEKRKNLIASMVRDSAGKKNGSAIDDPDLLEEVNGLVEEPNPILGTFDEKYLKLPKDVVVTAMREHQRYFSLVEGSGKLLPCFVAIANGKTKNDRAVRKGYEDILVSKLEDASFHWQEDTRQKLAEMTGGLKEVVWQENLGSLYDKCERLVELAKHLALRIENADSKAAERAAFLCKADLVSNMVRDGKEFAKLQGVMGREYAIVSGEDKKVATAIYEHYLPRFPGDLLPRTPEGAIVSVADRLDSIVGSFINGKVPTGSEDPYGVRRLANGMIAVIVDGGHHIPLTSVLSVDIGLFESGFPQSSFDRNQLGCSLFSFFKTRMDAFLWDKGISHDVTDAVMSLGLDDFSDVLKRAQTISGFKQSEEFKRLALGQKRVANILKGVETGATVDESMLAEDEEKRLFAVTRDIEEELESSIDDHDYGRALKILLSLRDPIDSFFDKVLVMTDDRPLRENRLALVEYVWERFNSLADFSKILTE
jgi:glycyl-tRNA synthetase beta chain